jgi:hypothetical protein
MDTMRISCRVSTLILGVWLAGHVTSAFHGGVSLRNRRGIPQTPVITITRTCSRHQTRGRRTLEAVADTEKHGLDDPFLTHPLFDFEMSKQLSSFPGRRRKKTTQQLTRRLCFQYESQILELKSPNNTTTTTSTGVIMIHPVGVGIGKWFYNRLLESLDNHYHHKRQGGGSLTDLIIAVPDLLGSGTAANPAMQSPQGEAISINKFPLLEVNDWSSQVRKLMADLEKEYPTIERWCLVANGGCSPIALQVAQQAVQYQKNSRQQQQSTSRKESLESSNHFQRPVTNVVLSSVPRLSFFLPDDDNDDDTFNMQAKRNKVQKSYKILCGLVGRFFWWYALRKNGSFIQKFSERNLVSDAAKLGQAWTPNCVATARMYNGNSRYSTFSFLAGSLQVEGCRDSLAALQGSDVLVDLIQGKDRRRNRAKSWFWQKRKEKTDKSSSLDDQSVVESPPWESLQQVLQKNGNRGDVMQVDGRISLAHEDAPGYAEALLKLLEPSRQVQ